MITDKINRIDFDDIESQILEICEYVRADEYDAAKEISDDLLEDCSGIYEEDENERYFCFDSPLQYYIYEYKLNPKKMIKQSKIDYRTLHFCNAHIYAAYEEYEKAEEELREALYWNPVDCRLFIELARIYRRTGEDNKFMIVIKAMQPYIISSEFLAKYHAEIGMYYLGKKDYQTAAAMLYSSETAAESPAVSDAIKRIIEETGATPAAPSLSELKAILAKDGLRYGVDGEMMSMIYDLSFELQRKNNIDGAEYCLSVLYDLTEDEKYLREIEFMRNNEE